MDWNLDEADYVAGMSDPEEYVDSADDLSDDEEADVAGNPFEDAQLPSHFRLGPTPEHFRDKLLAFKCHDKCGCWDKGRTRIVKKGGPVALFGTTVESLLTAHYADQLRVAQLGRQVYEAHLLGILRLFLPISLGNGKRTRKPIKPRVYPFGPVCMATWRMFHGFAASSGADREQRLRAQLYQQYPSSAPLPHGLSMRRNAARSPRDIDTMVDFVLAYSQRVGEAHFVRAQSGAQNDTPERVFLPANVSRKDVYKRYVEHCNAEEVEMTPLSESTFRRTWGRDDRLKRVVICSPRSDVCGDCHLFKVKLAAIPSDVTRFNDDEQELYEQRRMSLSGEYNTHVARALEVRDVMRETIERARESLDKKSRVTELSYTFDYAQNVAVPQFKDQPGPMYFFSLRNYYLFGVRDGATDEQFNFLYDEAGEYGGRKKSANVASLLYNLFTQTPGTAIKVAGRHASRLNLFAENCGGQNKNRTILWLLLIVVQSRDDRLKNVDEITLTFPIKGHTRNGVDRGFGVIKQRFVRSDVYTLRQMADLIQSIKGQHAVRVRHDQFLDFTAYGNEHNFRTIGNISTYQFFRVRRNTPGVVEAKVRRDDEWQSFRLVQEDDLESITKFTVDKVPMMPLVELQPLKAYDLKHKVVQYIPEEHRLEFLPETPPERRPDTNTQAVRRRAAIEARNKEKKIASAASSSSSSTPVRPSITHPTAARSESASSSSTSSPRDTAIYTAETSTRKRGRCSVCHSVGHTRRTCPKASTDVPTHDQAAAQPPSAPTAGSDDDDSASSSDSDYDFGPTRRRRRIVPEIMCMDCEECVRPLVGGTMCVECGEWVRCHRDHDDVAISAIHLETCGSADKQ